MEDPFGGLPLRFGGVAWCSMFESKAEGSLLICGR